MIVTAISAALSAGIGWYFAAVIGSDRLTDAGREFLPGGHRDEVEYNITDTIANGDTVALPRDTVLSPELRHFLTKGIPNSDYGGSSHELNDELNAKGAVPGERTLALYLQGRRRQGIRVTNIIPVEIRRGPVFDGALAVLPPQGPERSMRMQIDFDEVMPRARTITDSTSGKPNKPGDYFFPRNTIPLPDGKQNPPIEINTVISKGSVSFKIRVEFLVGVKPRHLIIDNRGQPFRLTAYACTSANRASYRYAVRMGPGGILPLRNPRQTPLKEC
ncbi:hypothetical protein BKA00_006424 [Actinomadura coerulea]|uniref:Uncharacterized protein n=1 Tax=Actinomadura coerulea TaxID=46159 RepID=A0A7X0L2E9_9ACTN|nr:hypothetical protein [Actinomadura coerulea]MBB6399510.1 hypothetical protein [Actinomadura coerulea]GGQ13212.1 hypothetical protein GCM10010187_31940 [Actinomadura coerulea]